MALLRRLAVRLLVALLRRLARALLGRLAVALAGLAHLASTGLEVNHFATREGLNGRLETTTERAARLETRLERLLERTGRQDRLNGRNGATHDGLLNKLTTTEAARRAGRGLAVRARLAAKVAALGLGATDLALGARLAGLAASTTLDDVNNRRLHLLLGGSRFPKMKKIFSTFFQTKWHSEASPMELPDREAMSRKLSRNGRRSSSDPVDGLESVSSEKARVSFTASAT